MLFSIIFLPQGCVLHLHVPPSTSMSYSNPPQTWNDAQSICKENCVDLVTISTMGNMATVLQTVEGKYDDAVWIGLHKGATPLWYWSLFGYDFFVQDPSFQVSFYPPIHSDCAAYKVGKLYTNPCSSAQYSVCFDSEFADCYIFKPSQNTVAMYQFISIGRNSEGNVNSCMFALLNVLM